jgi:hypothetical protein
MTKRNDGDATLGWIGGPQPLVGVLQVVVGLERARHGHLNR